MVRVFLVTSNQKIRFKLALAEKIYIFIYIIEKIQGYKNMLTGISLYLLLCFTLYKHHFQVNSLDIMAKIATSTSKLTF